MNVMSSRRLGSTRKIIDTNALQSPALHAYLAKSRNNFAVLTDYAAMEAYKGVTLTSIFRSMEILADFPLQVIVLKTTGRVCGLSGRKAGLQRRMIDTDQTFGFQKYCINLRKAQLGNVSARTQLTDFGRAADAQMARMLTDAEIMPRALEAIAASFTGRELKIIRTGATFDSALTRKVLERIVQLAQSLYSQHPNATVPRNFEELPNTFLFRSAVCAFIWALDWLSVGGPKGVKIEKIRNDLIDTNFGTYATYFDGLLSLDEKCVRIYKRAVFILDAITGQPSNC